MKISIITVTYNSEKHLERCINSVLNQRYHDIEYIIVDGNSTDATKEIINKYSYRISKFVSESDEGIYDAINKGIRLATGDVIGLLNSDDFFVDDNTLQSVVSALNESKTDIIFADIDFVSSSNLNKVIRHYSSKFFRPWMFKFGYQPAHPTFYTYRSNFTKYGLYRTDFKIAGDFELMLRFLLINNLSYKYYELTWVKMLTGGASTSGVKSVLRVNKEIISSFELNGLYTNYLFVFSKYLFKWVSFFPIRQWFNSSLPK